MGAEPFGFHVVGFAPWGDVHTFLLQALLRRLRRDCDDLDQPVGFSDEDVRQALQNRLVTAGRSGDFELRSEIDVDYHPLPFHHRIDVLVLTYNIVNLFDKNKFQLNIELYYSDFHNSGEELEFQLRILPAGMEEDLSHLDLQREAL